MGEYPRMHSPAPRFAVRILPAARAVALCAAAAVLAAACGTAAVSPSPVPATTPSATPVATPSPRPVVTPSPTESPTAAPTPTPYPPDWPVYHGDAGRSGYAAGFPGFDGSLAAAWSAKLDGAVYGQPIVVRGTIIAATENDSVYALDPAGGAVLWRRNLGTPVRLSSLPCGDIDPLGITGTAAYDAATDSVIVVAEIAGPHHVLFALDSATGTVRWSRDVDLPGESPVTHQQRPALAVANGYVYIGFGGLAGDCGQYTGKLVGVPTSGNGDTIAYRVPVSREGAVWATGGPSIDDAGNLYISIGNGSSVTAFDGSDSVVELSPDLKVVSYFAPSRWAADNAGDQDLGSMSPMLLPGGLVFADGKSGIGYVLRQGALGGIGGQLSAATVCAAFGAAARDGSSIYVPCSDGLRQVVVTAGTIHVGWLTTTGSSGPPVVAGGAVWTTNTASGRLYALDPATGAALATIAVGTLPHFASPTLWNGLVLVGTMTGVVAVTA
jgi:polyvinyl alcohol dehydrogenase (cytochrome)